MYHDRYSQMFNAKKNSLELSQLADDIERKCNQIRQAPYGACKSEKLKYDWTRKRSGRLSEGLRIIYKVCQECRKRGEEEQNHMVNCLPCEGVPDKTVNFLDITNYH